MKEFAEGLKQFGVAMQAELEAQRKQQMRLKAITYISCTVGALGFAISLFVILR